MQHIEISFAVMQILMANVLFEYSLSGSGNHVSENNILNVPSYSEHGLYSWSYTKADTPVPTKSDFVGIRKSFSQISLDSDNEDMSRHVYDTFQFIDSFLLNILSLPCARAQQPQVQLTGHHAKSILRSSSVTGSGIVGEVIIWPAESIPKGFLECDGQSVDRFQYEDLYKVIGTTYGLGPVINTFKVPDFRGYFLRGWDHGAGMDSSSQMRTNRGDGIVGDRVGTKQMDQFKSHSHIVSGQDNVAAPSGSSFNEVANVENYPSIFNRFTSSTGGSETNPKNINVMFIIRYQLDLQDSAFEQSVAKIAAAEKQITLNQTIESLLSKNSLLELQYSRLADDMSKISRLADNISSLERQVKESRISNVDPPTMQAGDKNVVQSNSDSGSFNHINLAMSVASLFCAVIGNVANCWMCKHQQQIVAQNPHADQS
jgi:microcystin-dependent protein